MLYLAFFFTSSQALEAMDELSSSTSESNSLKRKSSKENIELKKKKQALPAKTSPSVISKTPNVVEDSQLEEIVSSPNSSQPSVQSSLSVTSKTPNGVTSVSQRKPPVIEGSQTEGIVFSPDSLLSSVKSSTSKSSSALPLKLPETPKKNFLKQLNDILTSPPNPLPSITQPISAETEDIDGSRKWVPSFKDQGVHLWHTEMNTLISNVYNNKQNLPANTNFAISRLVFSSKDGTKKEYPLHYVFVSGWPANANTIPAEKLSQLLGNEKFGKEFKDYQLRFLTKGFKSGKQTYNAENYNHKDTLKEVYKKEKNIQNPIPSLSRLNIHKKVMDSDDSVTVGLFQYHYFHSEQALRLVVNEEINKFKESIKKPKIEKIDTFLKTQEEKSDIDHAFLDICSYYDVCWCCSDTLSRTCHTLEFGFPVYVRASGVKPYYDSPFSEIKPVALRYQRKDFPSYKQAKEGFEMQQGNDILTYKPYIAHSTKEDWK